MRKYIYWLAVLIVLGPSAGAVSESIDSQNYQYGIVFSQDLSDSLHPGMTLAEINSFRVEEGGIREAIHSAFASSVFPVMQLTMTQMQQGDLDIRSEVFRALSAFVENLEQALEDIEITNDQRFQVSFVPTLSPILKQRRFRGIVPYSPLYAKDKFAVVEEMPAASDVEPSTDYYMAGEVYPALGFVLRDHFENTPDQPSFLTLNLQIDLRVAPRISKIVAQAIVAPPVNTSFPFEETTDRIEFTRIDMPRVSSRDLSIVPNASVFPAVFLNYVYSFDKEEQPRLHVEFGPMGYVENGMWSRPPSIDFANLVPRLVGVVPAVKAVEVDFNVYNMTMDLERVELESLDIFLSFGTRYFTDMKLGLMNNTDVNEEFKTEINNTIQQQIEEQKQKLSDVSDLIATSDMDARNDLMDRILQTLTVIKSSNDN